MLKKSLTIAFAFVGIIVGAGFATGQEMMQFFVAFGPWGLVGAALVAVVMGFSGLAALELGSYFLAGEHTAVLGKVTHPWIARALDICVMVTLFCTGSVMFAGGGSNLNQQFGLPVPIGALLVLVLVLVVGALNVDKVTKVIGACTPFIIVLLLAAACVAVATTSANWDALSAAASQIDTTLPHWTVASVNYVGFNLMVAVSMAIIIGGSTYNTKAAGWGGLLGGIFFGVLLTVTTAALYLSVDRVGDEDLPVLSLVTEIHPVLGLVMSLVIFGMIFNTAIGMFYALACRLSANHSKRFWPAFAGTCAVGFILSFLGFRTLVAYVYPALGYVGIVLIAVLGIAWVRDRSRILAEHRRRLRTPAK